MGQYWKFVCMDNRQEISLGKLNEVIHYLAPDYLVDLLFSSALPKVSFPLPASESTPSTIEKLPIIVLDRICLYLAVNDLDDLLCFALSSRHFLEPAHRGIFKIASWAGKRIICIGDYADEYPQGFLSKQETSDIGNKLLFDYTDSFGPAIYQNLSDHMHRRAYDYTMGSYKKYKLLDKLLSARPDCSLDYDKHVLRNLTTKEYILASEMQKVQKQTDLGFNFGHVLACQICWSTDPSISFRCSFDIHQGPWAGHRFDITTTDKVDKLWKDVSSKVLERYVSIYSDDDTWMHHHRHTIE